MSTVVIAYVFQENVGQTPEAEKVPFLVLPWHSFLILQRHSSISQKKMALYVNFHCDTETHRSVLF